MAVPAFVAYFFAFLKRLFREAKETVAPEDPTESSESTRMKRNSSHLSLFHPIAHHTNRKTLVLDLDETLVHSSPEWVSVARRMACRTHARRVVLEVPEVY